MRTTRGFAAITSISVLLGACSSSVEPAVRDAPIALPTGAASATPARAASSSSGIEAFSKTKAMRRVRALANDIGPRIRASNNEKEAATYIRERFESLGYETRVMKYEVPEGASRNVEAWWPGARQYPLVVGGHMDTVPGSPGANDNASGIAVILENARLFAGTNQARFIRFVAFGSEEFGDGGSHHVGSQTYVNRLGRKGRRRLAGMVSVDMIADGRPLLIGHSGIASDVVARTVFRKVAKTGIAAEFRVLCDCSDNGPFERAGIAGSFMWSGDEPNYHSPSDTVANLQPNDLRRSGRALRAFLLAVDKGMLDRFRDS